MESNPVSASDRRWLDLLAQLDAEQLTRALLPLVEQVDGYEQSPIPKSEIRRTAMLSFEAILEGLRSGRLNDAIAVAEEMGVSRARAGVQLSSLMTAIRLDFAVLWDALTAAATDADAGLVVERTRAVLRTVDEFVGQAQRAFLAEDQRIRDETASRRGALIESLLRGMRPSTEQLEELAQELGAHVDTEFVVVAAVREDVAALRVGVAELERLGVRVHTHHFDGAAVAFTPRGAGTEGRSAARTIEIEARLLQLRVGFAVTEGGLGGLRAAAERARNLANLLAPTEMGAMTWERGWARQAARNLEEQGTPVLADVEQALSRCTEAKRERLLVAVTSYLETGSVSESARLLFCHRNTLSKQLQQFAELTGVDPTAPRQAARLVVGWA